MTVRFLTHNPRIGGAGLSSPKASKARAAAHTIFMYKRLDRAHRALPVIVGALTLVSVGVLFAWDAFPQRFPAKAHDYLGAFPLAMIAIAYMIYQTAHLPPIRDMVKAVLLAAAFLFWAANQLWPNIPQATLLNDLAIGLFVLDVFLVMIGWPANEPDESFAETGSGESPTTPTPAGNQPA